jgi:hypothetical protein
MKKLLALVLILGFYTIGGAQSSELIQGKWVFREALNKGIDKEGKKSLKNDFINKMTFEFKSNGKFVGVLFGTPESGKWSLSQNSKALTLSASSNSFTFQVRELSQKRLILKLGLGEFLMEKI